MFQSIVEVRGYELDSFNHVNNAVYLNYFEHARWEIIKEKGLIDFFRKSGNFLVVVETHIKYIREIKLFDKLVINTSIGREDPYLIFHHEMLQSGSNKKVSKATVKTLLLDETRTPIDMPHEILMMLNG